MPIPIGTLCLIVHPHPLAGRTCTIVKYEARGEYTVYDRGASGELTGGYKRRLGPIYYVDGRFPRPPGGTGTWGAEPRHLVPLAPPAAHERADKLEAVET